jgi:CPA1 family monovalent cation:H+ antiporter
MPIFTLVSAVIAVVALSAYANHKLVHLPDSIGITVVALLLSLGTVSVGQFVPQVADWGGQVARGVNFPDLVFHGLLGLLLFAGSLHVDVLALRRARWVVLLLATVGVLLSTVIVGGDGRAFAVAAATRERLFQFWQLTDDLLNLLLFGLVGLELTALAGTVRAYLLPAALALPLVLAARFVSVGLPTMLLRPVLKFEPHFVKLMTWAGLRGALSVALALSLPAGPARNLIVTATYLIAIFSILVQATTVEPLARRWNREGA